MSLSHVAGPAAPLEGDEAGSGRASVLRRLVVDHQAGDEAAFPDLVRLMYPNLYRFAVGRLRDQRAAEDAVQEALLRAYRSLSRLEGDYQVSAWLYRVLANVCHDEDKRRRRERDLHQRLSGRPEENALSADESTGRAEVARAVAAAVSALPDNYRQALVLRDVLELGYADVASRAGISEQNARARVSRARAALRRMVDSSIVLGGAVFGPFRRLGRASVEVAQHLAPSASTVSPDALSLPARASVAASTIAAAAIAAAAAVPVFTAGQQPFPPTPPRVGGSDIQVTAAPALPRARPVTLAVSSSPSAAAAAVTKLVAPTTSTSTTAPPPPKSASKLRPPVIVTSPSGPPLTVTIPTPPAPQFPAYRPPSPPNPPVVEARFSSLVSDVVFAQPGAPDMAGPGSLEVEGHSPQDGTLKGQALLPTGSPCSGRLSGEFLWAAGGQSIAVSFDATLIADAADPTGHSYAVDGSFHAHGNTTGMIEIGQVSGTVVMSNSGGSGSLQLELGRPSPSTSPQSCVTSPDGGGPPPSPPPTKPQPPALPPPTT